LYVFPSISRVGCLLASDESSTFEGVRVMLAGTPVLSKVGGELAGGVPVSVAPGVEAAVDGSGVADATAIDEGGESVLGDALIEDVGVEEISSVVVGGSSDAGIC
jgi:hypothetical protein